MRRWRAWAELLWLLRDDDVLVAPKRGKQPEEPGYDALKCLLMPLSLLRIDQLLYDKVLLQAPWHELF